MAENSPNNSDNSETIAENPAESPTEPAEPAAKKRGRPKGAADKAPRAPKKKAVVAAPESLRHLSLRRCCLRSDSHSGTHTNYQGASASELRSPPRLCCAQT